MACLQFEHLYPLQGASRYKYSTAGKANWGLPNRPGVERLLRNKPPGHHLDRNLRPWGWDELASNTEILRQSRSESIRAKVAGWPWRVGHAEDDFSIVGTAIVVEKLPNQTPRIVSMLGTEFLSDCGSEFGNGGPASPPRSAPV